MAFYGKPISELRSITCRMGSHSVTCHLTQVNTPHLNPSQRSRYSINLPWKDRRLSWPSYWKLSQVPKSKLWRTDVAYRNEQHEACKDKKMKIFKQLWAAICLVLLNVTTKTWVVAVLSHTKYTTNHSHYKCTLCQRPCCVVYCHLQSGHEVLKNPRVFQAFPEPNTYVSIGYHSKK